LDFDDLVYRRHYNPFDVDRVVGPRARFRANIGTLAQPNPALGTVSRQPQTTATPAVQGAPFTRVSRKGTLQLFDLTAQAFGSTPAIPPLKPIAGYHRSLRLDMIASGGSSANSPAAADAPFNVINNLQLRDPWNSTIHNLDGYGLYLVNAYGCQTAEANLGNDITKLPSYSAVVTTTGSFTVPFYIPLELDSSGYCSMVGLSAAAQPTLNVVLNSSATVYTTVPGTTAPTIELRCQSDFWAAPVDNPDLGPPGVGSSAQWTFGVAASAWPQSSYVRIQLPRVGTFIHTLILALRDQGASNARVDQFPSTDLTLLIDGVPIEIETANSRYDKMFRFSGVTRPTGVVAYTFRDSDGFLVQASDTHDRDLYTTPSTLLEVAGTSGGGGTGPFRIYAYTGELWPVGGIPYTHNSQ
jgi:hypothetical protein